jgi:mRNA interferase MazF
MEKDFEKWNSQKISINRNNTPVFFHERDIWFANVGLNIGFEQDGKGDEFLRPVIVIKKFNKDTMFIVPATKNNKTNKYHYNFIYKEEKTSTAILSQLKMIDSKRLRRRIGSVSEIDFLEIKKRIISLLE